MIYELSRDLEAMLRARSYPYRVHYGPNIAQQAQRQSHDPRIIVERARGQSDTVRAPQGNRPNARAKYVRELAAQITIYAKSSLPGARVSDHERECERIIDAVIVALYNWGAEGRAGAIGYTSAQYLTAADRDDVESWPGVVYVLQISVPRGVSELTYTREASGTPGEARPEAEVSAVQNQTRVRMHPATEDDDPEIGCGA